MWPHPSQHPFLSLGSQRWVENKEGCPRPRQGVNPFVKAQQNVRLDEAIVKRTSKYRDGDGVLPCLFMFISCFAQVRFYKKKKNRLGGPIHFSLAKPLTTRTTVTKHSHPKFTPKPLFYTLQARVYYIVVPPLNAPRCGKIN